MAIKLTAVDFKNGTTNLLSELQALLLDLHNGLYSEERILQCYKNWHKVKNLAAIFDYTDIINIAHSMEVIFFPENDNEAVKLTGAEISANIESLGNLRELIEKKVSDNTFEDVEVKPAATTVATSSQTKSYKILIIDDEPINTALLEHHIRSYMPEEQAEIISVHSAEEGLFHFFTSEISIIFLDIMMPVIDGKDFIAIVEKNKQKKNITHDFKIMVQTAIQSVSELTDLASKESVHEIIRKPISQDRLKECLERYCPLH